MVAPVFTDEELGGLRRFPEIGREELFRFFTAVDSVYLEWRRLHRTGMRKVQEGWTLSTSGTASAGSTSPTCRPSGADVHWYSNCSSDNLFAYGDEGGELMTVVETTAVRGARTILTSRASS
ncbi:hypothetical protein [Microbispora sp. CA-102843]|uniref:hypothetical protein n=1 Tax=Microbispora sp. CA-102843 TaxID=3239952 RepID=UPI003D8E30AB